MKIVREEQVVGPPITYITSVNVGLFWQPWKRAHAFQFTLKIFFWRSNAPMHGPACPSTQTPIRSQLKNTHRHYTILLLYHTRWKGLMQKYLRNYRTDINIFYYIMKWGCSPKQHKYSFDDHWKIMQLFIIFFWFRVSVFSVGSTKAAENFEVRQLWFDYRKHLIIRLLLVWQPTGWGVSEYWTGVQVMN